MITRSAVWGSACLVNCSLRGPEGGLAHGLHESFDSFFFMFFWNPLGYRFGAFGFILGCFGSQFVSILEALGRKNEAGNATPTPKGQNPKFAYSYTVFTVFFISKPSQKASKSRQNPLKISIFYNIHSRSSFFLLLLGFHGKTVILGFLWVPQGAANFHTFGVCFCPGGLWTIR